MNKGTGTFLIIGAGAALLFLLSRLSVQKKSSILLQSVKITGGLLSPRLLVTFAVQNPTRQKLTFKSLTGSLSVNDKYIANVSSFGDQVVQPLSETMINVTVRPSALGVFNSIKELLTTPTGETRVNVTGTANVDGFTVPVNENLTL